MKKNLLPLLALSSIFVVLLSSFNMGNHNLKDEYDVVGLYETSDLESGSKVLTSDGLEDVDEVLVPVKLETGKYSLTVTRKAKDVYKVDGKDIYIATKYSYEYAYGDDVILVVQSNYGYTKGTLIFLD